MVLYPSLAAALPSILSAMPSLNDPASFLVIGIGLAGVGLIGTRKTTTGRRK